MRDQLVNETIDARILRLLGLEDVFDLDYDTYLVLLKEAQIRGKNKIAAEEQALLANERKRVRGKQGRFKPKAKKITAEKFTAVKTSAQRLLPSSRMTAISPFVKSLEIINKSVESISKSVGEQNKTDKKVLEEERKKEENKKRAKREETLESSAKKVMSAAKKLFAPVRGLLDTIYNYLFYTFLGRAMTSALDWLGNPANKEKVTTITKFIKDFWPALLGGAAYLFTPLRGFINSIVGLVIRLGLRFPAFTAVALGITAAGVLKGKAEESKEKQLKESGYLEKEAKRTGKTPEKVREELKNIEQKTEFFRGFSNINAIASGGLIDQSTGLKISGAGVDTQLTALQPGEVVMNRAAVSGIGLNNLLAANKYFGGSSANRPRFANNIQFAQFGGLIGGRPMGLRGADLMRIMHGTKEGVPELIRQTGFRGQTGMLGKGVYGSIKGWVADTYRGAGAFKGILPGQGPRLNMLVPQTARTFRGATVVSERQANRGLRIAEGILSGKYTGAKARSLMPLLTKATPSMAQAFGTGALRLLGRATAVLNAPIIGDMLTPEAAGGGSTLQEAMAKGYYKGPMPKPPSKARSSVITLPPSVTTGGGLNAMSKAAGTEIPSFSAVAPDNRRMSNAAIYGLVQ